MSDRHSATAATVAARGAGDEGPLRPPVYVRRQGLGFAALVLVAGVAIALADSPFSQGLVGQWATLAIAGLGFYLAFGIGGQFSFCQAALVGVGAYSSAWLTETHGLPFLVGLAGAVAITALVAALLFLLIRRCDAFYFAIATLAFGFLAIVVFREWTAFAGPGGERRSLPGISIGGDALTGRALTAAIVAVLLVAVALALLIERSPVSREAAAVRHVPLAASTFGIDVLRIRATLFVAGAAYAGAAGCLLAHRNRVLSPEAFDIQLAIDLFLLLLFGGLGSAWGPVLGAAFVVWAPEQLRFIGRDRDLVFGALLIAIIIFVPDGLVGVAGRARGLFEGRRSRPPVDPVGKA